MGERAQVKIIDGWSGKVCCYLYTHCGAWELPEVVQRALSKELRWDDEEYLARIIFCEMVKGDEDGETGYGIGSSQHGDIQRLVEVDCRGQGTVTIYETYRDKMRSWSFKDYIDSDLSEYRR